MSKLLSRIAILLFVVFPLFATAQTSITGRVLNEKDGSPIEGASVVVKGKGGGTKTDANGNFTISANSGDVLVITSVNYRGQQVKVKGSTIAVRLLGADGMMSDVVVTGAMDIKRNSREMGYAAQTVGGNEIQESQRENFVNALAGRVAGVSITPTSGNAGASTNIVLRGYNSLALSNQPLFVVDGTIIDNSVIDENSSGGITLGLASDRPNRNNDYTNRAGDINPNDIETITVLKGPEATALYGSQAASGAIIITTKKAKIIQQKRFKISNVAYDNSFKFQFAERFPEMNTDYGMGSNGRVDSVFSFFGPKLDPSIERKNQFKEFFKTGFAQTHNLVVDFGNKFTSFKISGSYLNQSGVIPNNKYKRYTLRITNTTKISKYFDITPSITFTHSDNDKPIRGLNGYLLTLMRWPVNLDLNRVYNPDGTKYEVFPAGDANEEFDNPLWNVQNNRSNDKLDKQNATLAVNIYPTKWLTLSGRFGYESQKNDGWTFYHPETFLLSRATRGTQDNYYRKYTGYNHTITATAKKSIGKFNGRLMVGTMWQDYKKQAWSQTGNGIADATTFQFDPNKIGDSANSTVSSRRYLYRNFTFNDYNFELARQLAYFGEFAVNWNNIIFLNYTHRFEEGSALPKVNRQVSYPAGSVSVIFTDLIKGLKKSNFLSYGKLRGSLANTAKANSPYSNQSAFTAQTSSGGGFAYGFTNNNFFLGPEKQSTYEAGLELRFFKNKISIDGTYYNTLNKDQILELLRTSYGTGFILNTLNLSSTRNQGVEVVVNLKMAQKKNFTWNMSLNFNRSWNEVLSMPSNLPEFYIADTWLFGNARAGLRQGSPTTGITSWGYLRNKKGDVLIDPTSGYPLVDPTFLVRGDRNPDFTLGINNNFRLKNWTLNMLWDLRVGGDIFNGNELFMTSIGRSRLTANREQPQVIKGIIRDGLENTANPTPNNIVLYPYLNQGFYTGGSISSVFTEEYFIEKNINALRLRDITISYNFKDVIKKQKVFKNLSVFATATNLILFSNYTGADPAVNGTTPGTRGVGAFGFDYGTMAEPIGLNLGFRASF
jgi:TonB-linked SusC/RagA family outer membrane protein